MGYESELLEFSRNFREDELSKRLVNNFRAEDHEKQYSGSEADKKTPISCDLCLFDADSLSNRPVNPAVYSNGVVNTCEKHKNYIGLK